jgi:anti-anti-sigma factor
MLKTKTERAGDVVVVKCAGRVVRGEEATLEASVHSEKGARIIVLDLSDVEAVDAGGLNLLVSLHRWAEANRAHLKLVNPRPFVHEMLTRTHLDCVFDISSLDDALTVLGDCKRQKIRASDGLEAAISLQG